ncbi:MAG: TolC family protein [Phycisphaerales bacterium]|nr:TolC family protein [Phycisphaerales bacterium]
MRAEPTISIGLGMCGLITLGCSPSFNAIDQHVNQLLIDGTSSVNASAPPRPVDEWADINASESVMNEKHPSTVNPPVEVMEWATTTEVDATEVLDRLVSYASEGGPVLTLDEALKWAFENGREYRFAEEDYLLTCLSLVLELHLWTPQLADTVAMEYQHEDGDNDFLQSAQGVVNTFSASQRLPWGGELTASYVATFAREVYGAASGLSGSDTTRVGQFFVGGSLPLLRGAGMIAQEDLIQAERNLVYAARSFEQFRRDYWVRVVQGWFGLLVQRRQLDNAIESTTLLEKLAERQRALYDAGRARLYDAAEAENRALQERSRVAGLQESYRLAVDRFKLLINMPIENPIAIDQYTIAIDPPVVDLDQAVEVAMRQRLDLQTERNRLVDDQRGVRNALNGLLPDLDLAGEMRLGSNDTFYYDAVLPSVEDMDAEASLTLGLPLDRQAERIAVRQAQIALERGRRAFRRQRDEAAIQVRTSVRDIDANLFSLDIQRRNVDIARVNIESIDADPDSYTVLDQLSAIQSLQQAQNGHAQAFQSVQEAILKYLNTTGQMRISNDAALVPLPGMVIGSTSSLSYQQTVSSAADVH